MAPEEERETDLPGFPPWPELTSSSHSPFFLPLSSYHLQPSAFAVAAPLQSIFSNGIPQEILFDKMIPCRRQ